MDEQYRLSQQLSQLNGNPYRSDGQLKATSTLSREIRQRQEQQGGCGCAGGAKTSNEQTGGDYKKFPASALQKANAWRDEVNAVRAELGISYKDALKVASERRKQNNNNYKTTDQKYVERLDTIRKSNQPYSPYGSKNKRPLSLEAAQRILLQYYRQRADQYAKGPLTAMRKKISSCHKDPKKTLQPCPTNIKSKDQAEKLSPQCADSWKYRPGKNAKGHTGPGYYDMNGLDNLCGNKNAQAKKESQLYNMKFMHKKKKSQKGGADANQTVVNPLTGRSIKVDGPTHRSLIAEGHLPANQPMVKLI